MGEAIPPDPSPYRPPAMLAEQEPDQPDHSDQPAAAWPPLPLPLWVSAVFAGGAIAVHIGITRSALAGQGATSFANQAYLPPALLTLFMLLCLGWYTSQSLSRPRSLQGNILLMLLVLVALLNFVPAFLAITLVVSAVGKTAYLTVISLAVAYFAGAVGISRWLWWWFACQR